MRESAVGFQCPECVAAGQATVRRPRTVAGGRVTPGGAVTIGVIAVNVVAQVLVTLTGGTGGWLFRAGSMVGADVAWHGEYWRLLTSAFLHGSLLHLGFNMLALYLFGPYVEAALGRVRFLLTYLTVSVAASVFVYWLSSPLSQTVGASGAVFAIFGLALLLLIRQRQNVTGMLVLLAINGVISLQSGISWQGHLGGFVTGLLLGAMFIWTPRAQRTLVQGLTFVGLWILIAAAVTIRSVELLGSTVVL